MSDKYIFTKDMTEISGFGGGYEQCCRNMVIAGLNWLDENPEAKPEFRGYKNIYGVIHEDNEDAKNLSNAVIAGAGKEGASGAMHQATISACLYIKTHGWPAYVKLKTHPRGYEGILEEKLEQKTKDYEMLRKRYDELEAKKFRLYDIIAERVLGWKKYDVNNFQKSYAPNKVVAMDSTAGSSLYCHVEKAIEEIEVIEAFNG